MLYTTIEVAENCTAHMKVKNYLIFLKLTLYILWSVIFKCMNITKRINLTVSQTTTKQCELDSAYLLFYKPSTSYINPFIVYTRVSTQIQKLPNTNNSYIYSKLGATAFKSHAVLCHCHALTFHNTKGYLCVM